MIKKPDTALLLLQAALCLCAIAILLFPDLAFANAANLKTQAKQVSMQLANVPRAVAMISYVIGTFFAYKALMALRRYTDNPDEHPLIRVIGFASASALLISLPYIIVLTANTINIQTDTVHSSSSSFTQNF